MEKPEKKRIRTKDLVESENDETTQSHKDPINSNIYLTYDILRIVFKYLDARDLARVAMVSRLWSEAANNEKCTRGPECFIQSYKLPPVNRKFKLPRIRKAKIKPCTGFFFISKDTVSKIHLQIMECIFKSLPQNCETIMLYTSNIVIKDKEMLCGTCPKIVCALLPQIPNVKIDTFRIVRASQLSVYGETNYMDLFENGQQTEELLAALAKTKSYETACLMLFCNYTGHDNAMHLALEVQKSYEDKISSLWGGIVEDVYEQHTCDNNKTFQIKQDLQLANRSPICVAVLITGSIQSWSVVLEEKCKTEKQVEEKLKLFKEQVKLRKHSVGFMFACRARGYSTYKKNNVESSIFKALFPKVPLVGCFGDGEFGKNTIPNDKIETKGKEQWYNEYSTIFMILTYN